MDTMPWALTLQQVVNMAAMNLGEALGTPSDAAPFLWVPLAQQACDTIAQECDAYSASATFDTVANQPIYSGPLNLYKIESAYYTDSGLNQRQLTAGILDDLNDRYRGWENTSSGTPQWFITRGMNQILLFPTPDTSSNIFNYTDLIINGSNPYIVTSAGQRTFLSTDAGYTLLVSGGTGFTTGRYTIVSVTSGAATLSEPVGTVSSTNGIADLSLGGILMQGLAVPGTDWGGMLGTATYNPTMVCPLHPVAHMAVMWGTALLRCIQFPTKENMTRLPMIQQRYAEQKARVEDAAARWTQATRHSDRRSGRPYTWGYYG